MKRLRTLGLMLGIVLIGLFGLTGLAAADPPPAPGPAWNLAGPPPGPGQPGDQDWPGPGHDGPRGGWHRGPRIEQVTDDLLFNTPLGEFGQARQNRIFGNRLNWSADGCMGDTQGFNFDLACQRQDFGLNNYRDQHRLTNQAVFRIDQQFRQDLNASCRWAGSRWSHRSRDCGRVADRVFARNTQHNWMRR